MLLTCVFALKIGIPRRIYRYIVQYIKVNTTQEQAAGGGGGGVVRAIRTWVWVFISIYNLASS